MLKQVPIILRNNTYTFANFYVHTENRLLINNIKDLIQEPQGSMLLWGEYGVGKTHLLQATAELALKKKLSSIYVSCSDPNIRPELLFNLDNVQIICVDDIDCISSLMLQKAIFHLFNNAYTRGAKLFFSSTMHPQNLNLELKDLYSRLRWGINMQINALDDEGKRQALLLFTQNLGIEIEEKILMFLIQRHARNMKDLTQALELLVQASLSLQRKITIPLVKQILHISKS